MQVTNSVKPRCDNCQIIRRGGQLRVVCSSDPRHKQRQKGTQRKRISSRGSLAARRS